MSSDGRTEEIRARLAEQHRSANRRAASLANSLEEVVAAATDVATDDEHDPEGHTIAWERQQLAALLRETRSVLAEIELAERRLDEGRYGRCTVCGEAISAARLEALPTTPTCIDCVGLEADHPGRSDG